jgi:hypothetical protein
VNASPSCLAQRAITHVGASAHASVCTSAGARGPGGSFVAAGSGRASTSTGVAEVLGAVLAMTRTVPGGTRRCHCEGHGLVGGSRGRRHAGD